MESIFHMYMKCLSSLHMYETWMNRRYDRADFFGFAIWERHESRFFGFDTTRVKINWKWRLISDIQVYVRVLHSESKVQSNRKLIKWGLEHLTSSINMSIPFGSMIPICSLCREGCSLTLNPALYLATNFLIYKKKDE